MVLLFHFLIDGEMLAPKGYLAVDFFFLLSGLVIARTYDARLQDGLSFGTFAASRWIRLYPLFLAGLAFGLARRFGYLLLDRGDGPSPAVLLQSLPFETLMLPSPLTENMFVFNGPAWSLFFEMAISLLYAALLFRLHTRLLLALTVAFAALLAATTLQHGSLEMGLKWQWFHGGAARTAFSFMLGMLIARHLRGPSRPSWLALLPALGLIACLMAPGRLGPLYDLLFAMVLAPLLVWLGASVEPPAALQRPARWLGDLSYPVYAIHYPLMFLWLGLAKRAHLPAWVQVSGYFGLVVIAAWLLNRWWDRPVRRWLNARLGGAGAGRRAARPVPVSELRAPSD